MGNKVQKSVNTVPKEPEKAREKAVRAKSTPISRTSNTLHAFPTAARLPKELWLEIIVAMDNVTIFRFARVCLYFYTIINDEVCYQRLCNKYELKMQNSTYKQAFLDHFTMGGLLEVPLGEEL